MREKFFEQFLGLIKGELISIFDYFAVYNKLFERKGKETKTKSYGGYELTKFVGDFNQELNNKSSELLKKIQNIFKESGRKFSETQCNTIIQECIQCFNHIIDNYTKVFKKEFELNASLEVVFNVSKERMHCKFNQNIKALNLFINTKIDKALWWTAISTVFAGVSLILSVIAIVAK